MFINFDDMRQFGTNQFEVAMATTVSTAKGLQAVAAEATDYAKNSFEKSRVLGEKLLGVKKIEEAVQLQSDFAKTAYDDFIAQGTKIGNLYSDLAKEAFKLTKVASPAAAPASKAPVAAKQN